MKKIYLNKLKLTNFQGGNYEFKPEGHSCYIYGKNAAGKTRLFSAFTWLLFDKDSLGRSEFEIKNLDETGEPNHGLEHTVEAELQIEGDPEPISFRKTYKEVWTKKKGSAKEVFTGHTVEYFVNEIPIRKKDYQEKIISLAGDESAFKLLTSPIYFASLNWKNQREILLSLCENIQDSEIIAANPELASLKVKQNIENYRKTLNSKKNKINEELSKLPVRIDEQNRYVNEFSNNYIIEELESTKKEIEKRLNNKKLQLQGIKSTGRFGELQRKALAIQGEIAQKKNEIQAKKKEQINEINGEIAENEIKIRMKENNSIAIQDQINRKKELAQNMESELGRLRQEWIEIANEPIPEIEITAICPTCKRPLQNEQIEEAKNNRLKQLNNERAEKLKKIENEGKQLKSEQIKIVADIENLKREMAYNEKQIEQLKSIIETLNAEKTKVIESQIEPDNDIIRLEKELSIIEQEIQKEEQEIDKDAIQASIENDAAQLAQVQSQIAACKQAEQAKSRINELMQQEKLLNEEYEKIEHEIYLVEQFIKTKVKMLTDRINSKFEFVQFKLFNILVNGGIEETCEIMVNGVPYNAGLNYSARIQAGCDIIRTLQKQMGIYLPLFIDNRESVTTIPEMDCQVISLVVSDKDNLLRVEKEKGV